MCPQARCLVNTYESTSAIYGHRCVTLRNPTCGKQGPVFDSRPTFRLENYTFRANYTSTAAETGRTWKKIIDLPSYGCLVELLVTLSLANGLIHSDIHTSQPDPFLTYPCVGRSRLLQLPGSKQHGGATWSLIYMKKFFSFLCLISNLFESLF